MGQFKIYPLYEKLFLDTDTPITAYLKLTDNNKLQGFLLESKEKVESVGRYSIIGVFSERQFKWNSNPFDEIKELLSQIEFESNDFPVPFVGGLVGYFSYDTIKYIENLDLNNPDIYSIPDALFVLPDVYLVFDHFTNEAYLFTLVNDSEEDNTFSFGKSNGKHILLHFKEKLKNKVEIKKINVNKNLDFKDVKSNFSKSGFKNIVKKAKQYIYNGDIFQVVLSQRLVKSVDVSGFSIYRGLRSINPSPYMFYFNMNDFELIGSSPEILIKKSGNVAVSRPIAGTRKRGVKPDDELIDELLHDEKELAEHTMLVDLARNDVGQVSEYGSITIPELYSIEKYSHVIHIVSEVRGELKSGYDAVDLFKASFPAGTVSGAPKIRAMEIIEELENVKRSIYSGGIGYFSFNSDMDFCIGIRTIIKKANKVYVQAGAGIVYDSDPENEYKESINKAMALLLATNIEEANE